MRRIISRSPWILYGPLAQWRAGPDLLHVPRDNTGEGAPQIRRQNLNRLIRTVSGWPYSHATVQTVPERSGAIRIDQLNS